MFQTTRRLSSFVFFTACACLGDGADASLILDPGLVGGSGDVQNVLLTGGQQGLTVQGETVQTGELVGFTSNEILVTPAIGQARIEALDGELTMIMIQMNAPDLGFSKIQFNIDAVQDGFATITLIDQFGTDFVFSNQALGGSGSNFFTGQGLDEQVIVKVTIDTNVAMTGVSDLQQVRLDPTNADPVQAIPEPASFVIWGAAGLIFIGATRIRRRKR